MPYRRFLLGCAFASASATLTLSTPAEAQVETTPDVTDSPSPPPAPERGDAPASRVSASESGAASAPTESYWYGWQTLTVDGASLTTALLGSGTQTAALGYLSLGGLLLGSPIVHFAHGRVGAGFGSLALRGGLPILGGIIGYAAAGSCRENPNTHGFLGDCFLHGFGEMLLGGLLGLAGAIAIDAAVLARGERVVSNPRETGAPRITSLAPSFDPLTRTTSLRMAVTF